MPIALPGLQTIGWFNRKTGNGEGILDTDRGFGRKGTLSFMREWTTAYVHFANFCVGFIDVDATIGLNN